MAKTNLSMEININSPEGNIYYVLGRANKLLRENGQQVLAESLYKEVTESNNYKDALEVVASYVEVKYIESEDYELK